MHFCVFVGWETALERRVFEARVILDSRKGNGGVCFGGEGEQLVDDVPAQEAAAANDEDGAQFEGGRGCHFCCFVSYLRRCILKRGIEDIFEVNRKLIAEAVK